MVESKKIIQQPTPYLKTSISAKITGRICERFGALLQRNGQRLYRFWPGRAHEPIFIVGCPRSGTTILGEILGQTPNFLYLNEPRYIWCQIDSKLDIWAYKTPIHNGVLCWNANDASERDAEHLAKWFHLEMFTRSRRRLIEKMPENVFRMRWLDALFPKAKFIHIIRHGRDTALSLAEAEAKWFPQGYWETSRHYGIFRDYAARLPPAWDKRRYITEEMDNYPRALLVWLCAVLEGQQAGHEIGPHKYLEIRYEDLVPSPKQTLSQVYEFIGERLPENVIQYACNVVQTNSLHKPDPNPILTQAIAADLLEELGYIVA